MGLLCQLIVSLSVELCGSPEVQKEGGKEKLSLCRHGHVYRKPLRSAHKKTYKVNQLIYHDSRT